MSLFNAKPWHAKEESSLSIPNVEIHETENDVIITARISGLSRDNIDIHATEDMLRIIGTKEGSKAYSNNDIKYEESSFENFSKNVKLPSNINPDKININLDGGFLTVKAPKKTNK